MQKIWNVQWNSHSITAENHWFKGAKLLIDGQPCANDVKMTISSDLVGRIEDRDGSQHMVKAEFRQGWFGLKIVCHIFVDDRFVGGDPV